jgi:hypothetical protein
VEVVGQHHPGVDVERKVLLHLSHRLAQAADMSYQKIIGMAFEQIDGKEIGPTGHAEATVVGHGVVSLDAADAGICLGISGRVFEVFVALHAAQYASLLRPTRATRATRAT